MLGEGGGGVNLATAAGGQAAPQGWGDVRSSGAFSGYPSLVISTGVMECTAANTI